ncbi:MFS transporter [Aurantibacillus circumpalustris]|uniref:MFS transporter n=1 Tax=Aurantibacillus circumpalustris TaxID=3036359 RepID=UPI00295AFF26|nr:MFS transporter [Aurantibacillus circumpalustris]
MSTQSEYNKPYRWVVLMVYFGVVAMSQMLWLNFAPLVSFLQVTYGVSELMVSGLLLSFPLLYVLLSIHSGKMIDKKGYRYAVILGSVISTVFACLRIFDSSFYILLIGQTGIAIGQPYIINAISKLVSDWFSKEHTAMATGIGTAGMLIGMALGLGLTPVLNDSIGFSNTMLVFAAISLVLTLVFIFLAKENNLKLVKAKASAVKGEINALLKIRNLKILLIICFLALGVFNGLTSWLEPILKPNGINAEDAGLIGAFLIVGGILGSVIIPGLSDKLKVRKPFLVLCCLVAVIILYPLCIISDLTTLYILGALMGFFFLPGYALLLSMCEEIAGIEKAGTATGILMLAGNAGAVIVILLMPVVNGTTNSWMNAIYLMVFLMFVTLVTAIVGLKETFVKA